VYLRAGAPKYGYGFCAGWAGAIKPYTEGLSHHLLFLEVEIERKIKIIIVSFRNFGEPNLELFE
jgi:hypothetical protein